MKNLYQLFLAGIMILIATNLLSQVTVDGYCYLEGQTDHSGTKVLFSALSPTAVTDSTFTDETGYYQVSLSAGIYDVNFYHEGFPDFDILGQEIFNNTTLSQVILSELVVQQVTGIQFGVWESNHIYEVTGSITIPDNKELVIEPGVTIVIIDKNSIFWVDGTLRSNGTIQDSIYFKVGYDAQYWSDHWGGIITNNVGEAVIDITYTVIDWPNQIKHAFDFPSGNDHFTFQNNTLTNCIFFYVFKANSSIIQNNVFNQLVLTHHYACNVELRNNLYINNTSHKINSDNGFLGIQNNVFIGDQFTIIGDHPGLLIEYNLFSLDSSILNVAVSGIGELITINSNGDSCDTYYNLFMDPMIIDAENNNFGLLESSPCIDAGSPDLPYDPDGTISDIGAIFFDQGLHVNFEATDTIGVSPLTVQFIDTSIGDPTIWKWDFQNDGIIDSYEQNPEFVFQDIGTYSVKLIIEDDLGFSDTIVKEGYIIVSPIPIADFSMNSNIVFIADDVEFYSQAYGIISYWEWDFNNDGIFDSFDENPTVVFTEAGDYSVKLKVCSGSFCNSIIKENYFSVDFMEMPIISSILDVPNDQGKHVVINWFRSSLDNAYTGKYRVWRLQNWAKEPWEYVGEMPATNFDEYAFIAPTISDSTSSGIPYYTYQLSYSDSINQNPRISEPDSGYSVDNLSPAIPSDVFGFPESTNFNMVWELVETPDLDYFTIYEENENGELEIIGATTDPNYSIPIVESDKTVKITATDFNENESQPSEPIIIPHFKEITVPQGWSGFSLNLIPYNAQIEELFAPLNELEFFQDQNNYYSPSTSVNTIGNFNPYTGYFIKMNGDEEIQTIGYDLEDNIINLPSGWSILPILSSETIESELFFQQFEGNLIIAKEVAGWKLWWPEKQIFTLDTLEPNSAYLIFLSAPVTISF